jgi:predicted ArsR family transcriptional regulator
MPSATSKRVARLLLEGGPATAANVGDALGLTPAAVRRHLDSLVDFGFAASAERPAFGPTAPRGRGRPARFYSLTRRGRDAFDQAYDDLALGALRFLSETQGEDAVLEFARRRVNGTERRYAAAMRGTEPVQRSVSLVEVLSGDGYAAAVMPGGPSGAIQVCQHHCPVAHVAEEFPQFCEAETEAFERLLGSHVTRLATIAKGDGVCTTLVTVPASTNDRRS